MRGQIANALQLWVNADPDTDPATVVTNLAVANAARDQFLTGKLTWSNYLECLAAVGVDIESYCETSEANLIALGL